MTEMCCVVCVCVCEQHCLMCRFTCIPSLHLTTWYMCFMCIIAALLYSVCQVLHGRSHSAATRRCTAETTVPLRGVARPKPQCRYEALHGRSHSAATRRCTTEATVPLQGVARPKPQCRYEALHGRSHSAAYEALHGRSHSAAARPKPQCRYEALHGRSHSAPMQCRRPVYWREKPFRSVIAGELFVCWFTGRACHTYKITDPERRRPAHHRRQIM